MPKTLLTRRFDRGAERHLRSFFKLPDRQTGMAAIYCFRDKVVIYLLPLSDEDQHREFLMAQGREFRHGVSELPLPLVESSFPHPKENTE